MDTLKAWLSRNSLGHLHEVLSEADISLELLSEFDEDDFRELGLSLGNRKRLRRALAEAPPGEASPASGAERRHMSVMFVDMVDSTRISRNIDPEEMAELLRSFQNATAGAIARYNGYLAKLMGDGVLAYFGWPVAREDDVHQAIRAGVAAIEEVGKLSVPGEGAIACRVGIATGLVVVGDIVGSHEARERTVTGETPNLAARLETVAGRNRVVISDATARLAETNFELAPLTGAELKGFSDTQAAWQVLAERDHVSRYDARSRGVMRPILGRDREVDVLLDCWRQVEAGRGTAALIIAEAGIGKSRLVRAVLDLLADAKPLPMQLQCSPTFSDTALWPVVQYLRHLVDPLRLAGLDDAAARAAYLTECFRGAGGDDAETIALFAELLGIDAGQQGLIATLSPQQVRQRTLEALVKRWRAVSAGRPIFFEIEDIHWADPTTLQLINMMLKAAPASRSLAVLTSRPEHVPKLTLPEGAARIELCPLDAAASRQIASGLVEGAGIDISTLPGGFFEGILARTDGNPLFIEELTKSVIEKRNFGGIGGLPEGRDTPVPLTLQEMLMARLDHMNEVKAIAQTASCIGREFEPGLLVAIEDLPEAEVQSALERLEASELIFRRKETCIFKHALIRDAAYDSLLQSARRKIHGRIARHLQERPERQPDLIAQHAERAGAVEMAIENYLEAGAVASRRSANTEAVRAYQSALRCILTLPEGEARNVAEIECLISMGLPLIASRGYASEAVEGTYTRARELCERIGARGQLFDALRGLWSNRYNQGDFRYCLTLTTDLIGLAEELGGGLVKSIALRAHGSTNLSMDRFVEARRAYEGSIATADVSDMSQSVALYGENPAITARIMLGQVLGFGGQLDSALQMVIGAEKLARKGDQPISVVQVAAVRSIIALLRHDYASCLEAAEEEASVSLEHGFVHWHAHSILMTGVARVFKNEDTGNLEIAARGIENWKATGARLYVPTFCTYLADCALFCGRLDMARMAVEDGIAHAEANHERLVLSELQRLDALIHERSGAKDEALAGLDRSLATAARQGAWLFYLRGCTDRARLLMDRSLPAKAALEDLRAALDRIEEFRSGPDWQRGLEMVRKAAVQTDDGIL